MVVTKKEIIFKVNCTALLLRVIIPQLPEDFYFYHCLCLEAAFIANDFNCHSVLCFVVQALYNLSKRAFAQW